MRPINREWASLPVFVALGLCAGCNFAGLAMAPTPDVDTQGAPGEPPPILIPPTGSTGRITPAQVGDFTFDGGTILTGTELGISDGGNIGENGVIRDFKPGLAIRATGCILCHGQVHANLITDFGYGDSYYFGAGAAGISAFNGAVYGDHGENWATSQIWGTVLVPDAPGLLPGTKLAGYLRNKVQAPDPASQRPPIVATPSLYIGAPSASRVRALAGMFPVEHPAWNYIPDDGTSELVGLQEAAGYLRNDPAEPFLCDGDLIVDLPLLLDNLQLETSAGCRIYATRTVFVQGPIAYAPENPDSNLQISSARAIMLGLGKGPVTVLGAQVADTLVHRMSFWTVPDYFTREPGLTPQQKAQNIVADAVPMSELTDADAQQPLRRTVAFSRLLLNAPNIQSRYQGEFKGVIIAEIAIAALNNFAFRYDPVFERVAILPLLDATEYLYVAP